DVAGTTVLDDDAVVDAIQAACRSNGVRVERRAITRLMGMPKPLAIRRLLHETDTVAPHAVNDLAAEIYRAFSAFLSRRYRDDATVRPALGAVDVFRRLRNSGILVALNTGFSRELLDVLLDRLKWERDVVDATVASDEVAEGRPFPDLI